MKRMQLVAVLMAVVFIQWLIALPFLVDKLGGTYKTVGLLIGTSSTCYAVGSLLLHRFVLHFGHRRLLWTVLGALALCTGLCPFAPNLPLLFLIVGVVSVLLALFWTSWECMFSSQDHHDGLVRSLMRYCLGFTLGDLIGTWTGTALVFLDFGIPWLRLRLPFLLAAAFAVASIGLLAWIERSGRLARGYAPPPPPTESWSGGERFLPATRLLLLLSFSIGGITLSFVPLMVAKEMSDWEQLSPRVIALQPLMQAIAFLLWGCWSRWVHRTWPLWLCPLTLVVATALLLAPLTLALERPLGAFCFKVGLGLVGIGIAMSFLMNLLYSMEQPARRARNAGIHEAIVGFGMMLGPSLAGLGTRAAGNQGRGAFWVALGLAVVGLAALAQVWTLRGRCR